MGSKVPSNSSMMRTYWDSKRWSCKTNEESYSLHDFRSCRGQYLMVQW